MKLNWNKLVSAHHWVFSVGGCLRDELSPGMALSPGIWWRCSVLFWRWFLLWYEFRQTRHSVATSLIVAAAAARTCRSWWPCNLLAADCWCTPSVRCACARPGHRQVCRRPVASPGFRARRGMARVLTKSGRNHINFYVNIINRKNWTDYEYNSDCASVVGTGKCVTFSTSLSLLIGDKCK